MNAILITGGAGYIGSHTAKQFIKNGDRVVILDNLSHGYEEAAHILCRMGNAAFIRADLRDTHDLQRVFEEESIDVVMHFAALCSVDESMKHPKSYFENNTVGTLNLLEAMRSCGLNRIIFSSTCAVYGESRYLPVDERHPTLPTNPYGESKLMAEKMIEWYAKIHGFNYAIFRYFNVCGADSDGELGDSKKPSTLLVQNAVRAALGLEDFYYTCARVNTPDGTPIRDYIDVEDLAVAHLKGYQYLLRGGESITLNVGNGAGYSVNEIISEVENIFGVRLKRKSVAPRMGEYAAMYANIDCARRVLNWSPRKGLADSIKTLKSWYERHPKGFAS